MKSNKSRVNKTIVIAVAGIILVASILVFGTVWVGQAAQKDTKSAVHSVSRLYLDELAGRREQVVASNLKNKIQTIYFL